MEHSDERDRHRLGAHAVARDAAGGVGAVEENEPEETAYLMELQLLIAAALFVVWGAFAMLYSSRLILVTWLIALLGLAALVAYNNR